MNNSVAGIFQNKASARLRIYAYRILDDAHLGQLKVGQTTQDVKTRVSQQLKTAAIRNFEIVVDELAEREDGGLKVLNQRN
jgi:uncharacterized protein YceH (UPF0502 family)